MARSVNKAKEPKRMRGKQAVAIEGDALPMPMPTDADLTFFCGEVPTAKSKKLCMEFLRDRNAKAAALRAGWSEDAARAESYKVIARYDPFIRYLEAMQAKANAKQIAIELEPALQELAKIAFCNEYDYLVMEEPADANSPPKVRRKRLDELTREQMIPVVVVTQRDGTLSYRLRDKEARLVELIKHLGGFNETIILEHRHRHLHAHIDLTDAPLEALEQLESQMEQLLTGKTKGAAIKVN